MTSINTENKFFKGKRTWSKIKDQVIGNYLVPYLRKVSKLRRKIVIVDAFAGPGIFEDGSKGSPLIICEVAEKHAPGEYLGIFVNRDKKSNLKLEKALNKYIQDEKAITIKGNAQDLLKELSAIVGSATILIYLDPFGLKECEFNLLEPYLGRDKRFSTEIIINMSMPTLHRLATRKVHQNGKQTERSKKLNKTLTKVLGGDFWKEIMWNISLDAKKKEFKVMKKYRELLTGYLPYSGSCPVRESPEKRIKYFITFCSRHQDAMLLMNDIMCKAYFKYMHEKYYKDTLFKDVNWRETRNLLSIKEIIMQEMKTGQRYTRKELWFKIVKDHFKKFLSSEYNKAIKQIIDEGNLNFKNPENRKRLNDNSILFIDNRNSNLNKTDEFLIKEKVAGYPQLERKSYKRIKVHFNRYRSLDNKVEKLVSRVNDGSIITRFDKTPSPKKLTDVICPHFLELKWGYGCPFDCAWCYLKGTFRFHKDKILPGFKVKDFDKIRSHVKAFLENVDNPEILNTGEIADSLMYENSASSFSKFIIPLFEKQSKHKVLFVTKSTRIKNLLEIYPHRQVVISFSLNAIPVANRWEKGAPSVMNRIEAAKKLSNANYKIRIRIDPMVPIESWQKYYKELVKLIFLHFIPERITIGSLRGLQSTLNVTKDNTWKKYLRENSNWGKKIDFTTRLRMYLDIINYLKKIYDYNEIALCKETKAMWQKLGMDYRKIKCNCIW